MPQISFHSPLGPLTVSEEEGAIVSIDWGWGRDQVGTPLLAAARAMLDEYFDGSRRSFDLPLRLAGTPYQGRVWAALLEIGFGETDTYGRLAARVGGSARSIGQANRSNPIPIIVPCHRVVASSGLGGYTGGVGIDAKRYLLQHEQSPATSP